MSQSEPGQRRTRRPRVGYITPRISNQHGLAIWRGMVETAQRCGADLICFPGGEVQHPEDSRTPAGKHTVRNAIYDLVHRESLDGLVVWGSSLGYYAGPAATREFLRQFEPLPLVSIGVALPGIPGVVLDSYGGLRSALAHLIEVHGRRRIAFIRGPLTHREAGERYRSYCDTLAAYGIPLDPDLVSPPYLWVQADGAELPANGAEAVRVFLDDRHATFDALIAASDTFALGAVPALIARGRQVPEQVSVIGFDDRPASRTLTPPLTTLNISMQERGRQALLMLLARLEGESVPSEIALPARLVIRRSCGCFDPAVVRAGESQARLLPAASPPNTLEDRAARLESACAAIARELEAAGEPAERARVLLDAFLAEVEAGAPGSFLVALDAALSTAGPGVDALEAWQDVISALREHAPYGLAGGSAGWRRAEALWHQARVLIGERIWRAEADADGRAREQSERLHAISRSLTLAVDVPELMDVLARGLPGLGINSCAVALYDDPQAPTGWCRLVMAYDGHGRALLPPGGEPWPAPVLASGGWLAQQDGVPADGAPLTNGAHTVVVEPLNCRDEALGFIMLDASGCAGQVYHVLQEQIGSALKGVLLLQENVRLYHAALAAQEAAQEKQHEAEEADRLKSRFLSMVSHELRTPLILLEGLSEMMLREGLGSRPPLPEPYRQDLARIGATAQQLGGLVRDVLDLARSQVGQLQLTTRRLNLGEALQPTLLVGEQMARGKGLSWTVDIAPDLPIVCGDAARLQQVTLNLISNAVKFTARGGVCVEMAASDDGEVTVSVGDTGLGVPLDEQEAIFDEFRQSERTAARGFGGLGVGLAICRQIVSLHGGKIGVRSSGLEDGGSTFYYRLPASPSGAAPAVGQTALPPSVLASGGGWRAAEGLATTAFSEPSQAVVLLTEHATGGELLRAHLLNQGFAVEVLAVEGRDDWLAQLLARRPGAVVLDLQPTWTRGWEIFDILKRGEATEDIPVLLYSLLAEEDGAHDAVGARGVCGGVLALDYVGKPIGPASLARALRTLGISEGDDDTRTVLIADDDPAVLELHGAIVAERYPNCRILKARNGREALDFLKAGERPRFVLLDLAMPELDGLGVLAAMQADPRWRDLPVIVLTAQRLTEADMDHLSVGHLSRGVASVLFKGMLTAEETLAQVEQALARNKRLGSEAQRLARKVMAFIHGHYADEISREEMAAHAGISVRHLTRCFAQETGMSPIDYLNRFRIAQARRLIDDGGTSITEVMGAVGFSDSSYFSRIFRREVGMSPSAYRNRS